jgi:hypothetical protein
MAESLGVFNIERVVTFCQHNTENMEDIYYIIKWEGYNHNHNTIESWLYNSTLRTNNVILRYMRRQPSLRHYIPDNIEF